MMKWLDLIVATCFMILGLYNIYVGNHIYGLLYIIFYEIILIKLDIKEMKGDL